MTATSPVRGLSSAASGRRFARLPPRLPQQARCPGRWPAMRRTGGACQERVGGSREHRSRLLSHAACSRGWRNGWQALHPLWRPGNPRRALSFRPHFHSPAPKPRITGEHRPFVPTRSGLRVSLKGRPQPEPIRTRNTRFHLLSFLGLGPALLRPQPSRARGARFPRMRDCPPPDPTFGEACGLSFSGPGVALFGSPGRRGLGGTLQPLLTERAATIFIGRRQPELEPTSHADDDSDRLT